MIRKTFDKRLIPVDRMGPRGLRPVTLPHHRTCGFPHPAVEQGGFSFSSFREVPWYDEPVFVECFGFQC